MSLLAAAKSVKNLTTYPSTNIQNPLNWLINWAGGDKTASGETVTPDNAIGLPTLFNAITLLSESVAQLPKSVYIEEKSNGRKTRRKYTEHASYNLIAHKPNDYMTSFTFHKVMTYMACLYDEAFAAIE